VTWLQAAFIAGSNLALAAGLMYQRAAILALWKLTRRGFLEALKVDPDAQADAIKAAVDKERERCLAWATNTLLDPVQVETGIESSAPAPGAVSKDGGVNRG